ncbi:uncharacterized protein FFE2_08037 [Fusarium fujikuroi]|nr:uncharacterized protein FFE2_08037 [Fusarium fujikuroi]
MPALFLYT